MKTKGNHRGTEALRKCRQRPFSIALCLRASVLAFPVALIFSLLVSHAQAATRILFIGNSFTYGAGSQVEHFRPELVGDLNRDHNSGMPALFKALTDQLGLDYSVSLETSPGVNFDWHWNERLAVIDGAWDHVVMQGYSLLDAERPGDTAKITRYVDKLARRFRVRNEKVELSLLATWARADQIYRQEGGRWFGKPLLAMTQDLQRGYEASAAATQIRRIIPVGLAWQRAFDTGVALSNPYDPASKGLINLWADDSYHASKYGSYLEALTVLASITGCDPRLGDKESVAQELGIAPADAAALQQVAWESEPGARRCR